MNHIYKVIWSRVKNSYVVVSEIAGTARKSGRVRASKNTLAAVLAAFLFGQLIGCLFIDVCSFGGFFIDRDFCKPCICGA